MYKISKIFFAITFMILSICELIAIYFPNTDELTAIYLLTLELVLLSILFVVYYFDHKHSKGTVKKFEVSDCLAILGVIFWLIGSKVLMNQFVILLVFPLMMAYLIIQIKKK